MTFEELVEAFSEQSRCNMAIEFLEIGLPIWEKYAYSPDAELSYYAEMLGMLSVDEKIIADLITLAKKFISPNTPEKKEALQKEIKLLLDDYNDHYSGLRNWELELPSHPKLIFYSAYNLLEYISGNKKSLNKECHAYLSLNQSIDAITAEKILDFEEAKVILAKYKKLDGIEE